MTEVASYWQDHVDDKWVSGAASRLWVDNPGSGEWIAEVAMAGTTDVERAVQAAKHHHQNGVLFEMPVFNFHKSFVQGFSLLRRQERR